MKFGILIIRCENEYFNIYFLTGECSAFLEKYTNNARNVMHMSFLLALSKEKTKNASNAMRSVGLLNKLKNVKT